MIEGILTEQLNRNHEHHRRSIRCIVFELKCFVEGGRDHIGMPTIDSDEIVGPVGCVHSISIPSIDTAAKTEKVVSSKTVCIPGEEGVIHIEIVSFKVSGRLILLINICFQV